MDPRKSRWELKTEDQLGTKSYIGFFEGLDDDFLSEKVKLLTGSFKLKSEIMCNNYAQTDLEGLNH